MPDRTHPLLAGSPYLGYCYAYPHKTAYRMLARPVPLGEAWQGEPPSGRLLYLHVPFCEMRCGFCNLFTQARPEEAFIDAYLDAIERQVSTYRATLGEMDFSRCALGGGTPTYLGIDHLRRLLELADRLLGDRSGKIPTSVETSPTTATWEKLQLIHDWGATRISIGVQSFLESETAAAARPQVPAAVHQSIERIRALDFPILNLDLIYGLPGQTVDSWLSSIRAALRYSPEELYLYPLYVRPLTSLGLSRRSWDDLRLDCYRAGRDHLLSAGYEQKSMRLFRARHAPAEAGPAYCCQDDGMIGMGCGARSYSRTTHYATEYGVRQNRIHELIEQFTKRSAPSWAAIDFGFQLADEEQRRRFLIQSILSGAGLSQAHYRQRFESRVLDDFPELVELSEAGLADIHDESITLTSAGTERSDAIGPWFYSAEVRGRMETYSWD